MQLFLHVEHADAGADAQKVRDRWVATAFLGPHPLCASLFTPGLKGLCDPRVDEGRDGYVGFNSFLAEQMRTSIPKVTNGVMKVALNSFLRMAHILRMVGAG